MTNKSPHIPVLESELTDLFSQVSEGTIIDCTAGFGGHISALLEKTPETVSIIGIDRDLEAIAFLQERFKDEITRKRVCIIHERFSNLRAALGPTNEGSVISGIYADIGVSSYQLDQDQRGFSFMREGPLDMRMNQQQSLDAKQIVNEWDQEKLIEIFRIFGEEPRARYFANAGGSKAPSA